MYSHHATHPTTRHAATARPAGSHPLASAERVEDEHGSTVRELAEAIRRQDRNAVARLVRRDPDSLGRTDRQGNTPLHLAIVPGCDPQIVQLLLDNGADPADTNADGNTAMHLAFALRPPVPALPGMLMRECRDGRLACTLGMPNAQGQTAIQLALEGGRIAPGYEQAVADIEADCAIWKRALTDGLTAAVAVDRATLVRTLVLASGWRVDTPVSRHGNLLAHALAEGAMKTALEVIKLAGEQGCRAVLNATDAAGELTPLTTAACDKDMVLANVLIQAGADVNGTDALGVSPLHIAATQGDARMVRMLLTHGARVDVTDKAGCTPLMCAALSGHADIVKILLEAGGDIDAQDRQGMTPVMHACSEGHVGLAQQLLAMGARRDAADLDGYTVQEYLKVGATVRQKKAGPNCAIV